MTVTQSFKIYEILHRYFKNETDAKLVVQEIETIVDTKVNEQKSVIASKEDISLLRQDILKMQVEFEKRFNQMIIWTVSTGIAIVGIIVAFIRLK